VTSITPSSSSPRSPLESLRDWHARLYPDDADRIDGRYWSRMLANLARAVRAPYRSLNELTSTLELTGPQAHHEKRRALVILALHCREESVFEALALKLHRTGEEAGAGHRRDEAGGFNRGRGE
jgi:hypothetical protein